MNDASGLTPAPPPPPDDPWAPMGASPTPGAQLAEFGPRAYAAFIDFFVRLGILAACVGVGCVLFIAGEDAGVVGLIGGLVLGAILTYFVYAPVMMARTNGQTVGHRVAKTRVVMVDGSRITGGRAFVREALVKNILIETVGSFTFYVLPIVNYLFPLWDPNNETLHDKMCSTRVVMT